MTALLALTLLTATVQSAPPEAPDAVRTYFEGERRAGGSFLGVGLGALAIGGGLLTAEDRTAYHAAWPVLGIGLAQAAAGVVILSRSDGQIRDRLERIQGDLDGFLVDERARLDGVHRDVTTLIWVEVALSAVGGGLIAAGEAERIDPMAGVGYGLALQAVVMLVFDLAVSDRADAYRAALSD